MKKFILSLCTGLASLTALDLNAQAPKLYLNLVSHNEPKDSLQKATEFAKSDYWVRQFAALIRSKGAKWNLQTCDGFLDGAINHYQRNAFPLSKGFL